jgi:hypothetical protein
MEALLEAAELGPEFEADSACRQKSGTLSHVSPKGSPQYQPTVDSHKGTKAQRKEYLGAGPSFFAGFVSFVPLCETFFQSQSF